MLRYKLEQYMIYFTFQQLCSYVLTELNSGGMFTLVSRLPWCYRCQQCLIDYNWRSIDKNISNICHINVPFSDFRTTIYMNDTSKKGLKVVKNIDHRVSISFDLSLGGLVLLLRLWPWIYGTITIRIKFDIWSQIKSE
jgi:hypothetical protein